MDLCSSGLISALAPHQQVKKNVIWSPIQGYLVSQPLLHCYSS